MFNISIEKEIAKVRDKSKKQVDDATEDIKLLLDHTAHKEREALKVIGLDNHTTQVERKKGVEIERDIFEAKFKDKVLTTDEIKNLCIKFNLRFLQTREFKGAIDQNLAVKVAKFKEENESTIGNHSTDFYIMAPPEAFKQTSNKLPKRIDPVLFYRIPGSERYVIVHKWGKDFTMFRRFSGWYNEASMHSWIFNSMVVFFAIMLISANFINVVLFTSIGSSLLSLLMLIPSFIIGPLVSCLIYNVDPSQYNRIDDRYTTKNLYSSTSKNSNHG